MIDRVAHAAAVGGFTVTGAGTYYQAPAAVLQGSASMWRIAVLYQHKVMTTNARLISGAQGAADGWNMWWPNVARVIVDDGAGNPTNAEIALAFDTFLEKAWVWGFGYDGTSLVAEILDYGTVAAVAATPGYTPAAQRLAIGARSNGGGSQGAESQLCIALLGSDSEAADAGDINAAMRIVKANLEQGRALDAGLALAPEEYFDAADIDWINGTWTARIGGGLLNAVGSPLRYGVSGRVL